MDKSGTSMSSQSAHSLMEIMRRSGKHVDPETNNVQLIESLVDYIYAGIPDLVKETNRKGYKKVDVFWWRSNKSIKEAGVDMADYRGHVFWAGVDSTGHPLEVAADRRFPSYQILIRGPDFPENKGVIDRLLEKPLLMEKDPETGDRFYRFYVDTKTSDDAGTINKLMLAWGKQERKGANAHTMSMAEYEVYKQANRNLLQRRFIPDPANDIDYSELVGSD